MEPDGQYRALEERVKDLATQVKDVATTMTDMRITLGKIEERTSAAKEVKSEVGSTNKVWLGSLLTAVGIILALIGLLFKK